MTRFLLSLDDAVDTVFAALRSGRPGETYIPRAASARMVDLAAALIGDRDVAVEITGVRPGEKIHEILVSEEEAWRTTVRGDYLAIGPILPELREAGADAEEPFGAVEYSSGDEVMDVAGVAALLEKNALRVEDAPVFDH